MEVVPSAAYLELCLCGEHGHIIFPDKSRSAELGSKRIARLAVQVARACDNISTEETFHLLYQIDHSDLIEEHGDIPPHVLDILAERNGEYDRVWADMNATATSSRLLQ